MFPTQIQGLVSQMTMYNMLALSQDIFQDSLYKIEVTIWKQLADLLPQILEGHHEEGTEGHHVGRIAGHQGEEGGPHGYADVVPVDSRNALKFV